MKVSIEEQDVHNLGRTLAYINLLQFPKTSSTVEGAGAMQKNSEKCLVFSYFILSIALSIDAVASFSRGQKSTFTFTLILNRNIIHEDHVRNYITVVFR